MICDRILQHLPTLLALSVNSPFWQGRNTGLHSHRSQGDGDPADRRPAPLDAELVRIHLALNHMVETGFIKTIREIWWDVRPHHNFGTVEVRICDMPPTLDHVLGLTALIQCLVHDLSQEIDRGTYQYDCHPFMVRQNKWRACRYGMDASLVDPATSPGRPGSPGRPRPGRPPATAPRNWAARATSQIVHDTGRAADRRGPAAPDLPGDQRPGRGRAAMLSSSPRREAPRRR